MNLAIIFLTGLTTGGVSCAAMQGGLLASVIANQKDEEIGQVKDQKKNVSFFQLDQLDYLPVSMFLISKLIAHTILGFLLGSLGSLITLSLPIRLSFQIFAALFMLATAMNLLDVHPIFRYLVFQPPKFLTRMLRNSSKSKALFTPAILGLMTVFVPCGVTQAMEVLAINSGSPITGALTMMAFVLGTSPLFMALGVATAKLSEGWSQKFMKFAALVLIAMSIYSVNGVLLVLDSPITLNKIVRPITYFWSDERFNKAATVKDVNTGVQKVTIQVTNNGYSPKYLKVTKGSPVELTLISNDVYSCALTFVLKQFGINTSLKSTDQKTFTFTPTKAGKYTFTCSMGMYSGTLEVTN